LQVRRDFRASRATAQACDGYRLVQLMQHAGDVDALAAGAGVHLEHPVRPTDR